jgi:uncharacterized protein (TIGR03083 family)
MDLNEDQLLDIAFDAALSGVESMPPRVWDGISGALEAGQSRKPMQHAGWKQADGRTSPLSAFIDTAAEFGELLDSLTEGDWDRRTRIDGIGVRDMVEHLVGMERYLLGQLGRRSAFSADRREDHWPATRAAAADLADLANADVARTWWQEVLSLIAACGQLGPDEVVRYHHLAGSVGGMLVTRTFELWTHGDDIRQAVNRPLNLLDDERLGLMVSQLMRALPIGVVLTGQPIPGRTARFIVTGAGGGVFDVPLALGETPHEPDITVTTEAVSLCRLAANRLERNDLPAVVAGDQSLLDPVLIAATAFSAD